jgi:hypothetical protein
VNKRVYKHKLYIKQGSGTQHLEFSMLFKLPYVALIREIQIAFINFWSIENEVYLEPLSVLVQAGLDENNLTHVCTLDVVKDNAFSSVNAIVYAKNMQEFGMTRETVATKVPTSQLQQTVEQIVRQKLDSLSNFKARYINFSMRRNVLTCLENSPLAPRILKPQSLCINYISVTGYDVSKVKGRYASMVVKG